MVRADPELRQLGRYLQLDKRGKWICAWGKYKGTFLDDAVSEDPKYFEWFLLQDIPNKVREVIEAAVYGG